MGNNGNNEVMFFSPEEAAKLRAEAEAGAEVVDTGETGQKLRKSGFEGKVKAVFGAAKQRVFGAADVLPPDQAEQVVGDFEVAAKRVSSGSVLGSEDPQETTPSGPALVDEVVASGGGSGSYDALGPDMLGRNGDVFNIASEMLLEGVPVPESMIKNMTERQQEAFREMQANFENKKK